MTATCQAYDALRHRVCGKKATYFLYTSERAGDGVRAWRAVCAMCDRLHGRWNIQTATGESMEAVVAWDNSFIRGGRR